MLSKRINELRTARGWSQVELAHRLQISKQTVSNWENDNVLPSIEMLLRLADFFGVTADYLLGREATPTLSADGLSAEQVAHLRLLIKDFAELNAEQERLRNLKPFDPTDRR